MTSEDIREMSFQNVLDTILKPAGVTVGGYPEDLFLDLSEDEREKWNCNICYLVVREARECANKHLFCNTCVFAWSLTYGENSQKCPMCRVNQRTYLPNKEVTKSIGDKRVRCPEAGCSFRAPLQIFLMHSHGKLRYANHNMDLESLRPLPAAHAPNLIILPGGIPFTGDMLGSGQRANNIREQLQQGRAMIHQMMLLLHLEMQLRQQAFVSYSQAQDPNMQLRRLDEVLALNEQLDEVGTILSALLSTPMAARAAPGVAADHRIQPAPTPPGAPRRFIISRDVIMSRGGINSSSGGNNSTVGNNGSGGNDNSGGSGATSLGARLMARRAQTPLGFPTRGDTGSGGANEEEREENGGEASDASDMSSVPSLVPRMRMSITGRLHSPQDGATGGTPLLRRPQRRNELRTLQQSLGGAAEAEPETNVVLPARLVRHEQSSPRSVSNEPATPHTDNHIVSETLQRLGPVNTSTSSGSIHNDGGPLGGQTSTLPPLPGANGTGSTTPRSGQSRRTSSNASASSDFSPRGQLPTGSSAHQRIMSSLTNRGDDLDEEQAIEVTSEGQHSAAQQQAVVLTPFINLDALRGPRVTSEGVTASGAIFSTSADTPLTRATSIRPSIDVSRDSPRLAAASPEATRQISAAAMNMPLQTDTEAGAAADSITELGATGGQAESPRTSRGRSHALRYAPQRRFRREFSVPGQQGPAAPSQTRRSRGAVTERPSVVPYVPHRSSGNPAHTASRVTNSRMQALSDDNWRRSNFTTLGRPGDQSNESVLRRTAYGRSETSRANLPTTPGQLLRTRRLNQSRRGSGPRDGPGGTI